MLRKDECYYLGEIIRIHGLKGNIVAKLDTSSPEEYFNLESVFLELNKKLIPFFIDEIRIISDTNALIKFEDIESEDDAKELVGANLYLPLDDLPELEDGKYYFHDLVGLTVVDVNHGEVGRATGIVEYPSHQVLEVHKCGVETLIPITDDIIKSVDKVKKIVLVECPEGLLDLNSF